MRRFYFWFLLLQPLLLPVPAQSTSVAPATVKAIPINLGRSVFVLTGPWRFRTGDDLRWAEPDFDDSDWETVDLAAAPGAHDADVGLTGYVPGWAAKGHPGYSGYAWYRITTSVLAPPAERLALAGPADVDDAYQVFFNGRLLGSAGDFSVSTPTVYSIQPRLFPLTSRRSGPTSAATAGVIAFRVWMSANSAAESPDAGGMHIAPALGEANAIEAFHRLEWLQTFCGYVVDAIEPILFLVLAVMSCVLFAFDRSDPAYLWFCIALLLSALVRVNQPIFFWTQHETVRAFYLAKIVVLVPLALGAWVMVWRSWFRIDRTSWIPRTALALTLLYIASEFTMFSFFPSVPPHSITLFHYVSSCLRLLFAALLIYIVGAGAQKGTPDRWLAVSSAILISIGLFATELSVLHVPSIWFPFGTGVSRTQFAYAAFDLVLFILLLRRILYFAQRFHELTLDSKRSAPA